MSIYFDNAATTIVRSESVESAAVCMSDVYGNPSSTHSIGRKAAGIVSDARSRIAKGLGADSNEIFFTSGGTESDNWAVRSGALLMKHHGRHIISSEIEHPAVLKPLEDLEKSGWHVTYLSPDCSGIISAESFNDAIREDTVFASIMLVNNETGAINPIPDYIAALKRKNSNALFHSDAVQGFCKIPFTVKQLGADFVSISAHKIHGLKGSGALYVRKGLKPAPLLYGGGQENERRSGTENVPALAAFGLAAQLGIAEQDRITEHVTTLRDFIKRQLQTHIPKAVIIPGGSPYILGLSLPGYKSEVLINYLDGEGICATRSAACKKGRRSRVLEAMKLPNTVIDGAIRISFSRYNTREECEEFIRVLTAGAERLAHN